MKSSRAANPETSPFVPTLLLFLAIAISAGTLDAQDWPQWRGAGGLGVTEATGLPEEWGPASANVRWRTQIPGEGISSPIVSQGQVFVTTAYEGSGDTLRSRLLRIALVILALGFAAQVLARYRRAITSSTELGPSAEKARRRAARLVAPLSLLFVFLTLVLALRPELILEAGNPGRSWRAGGTLALFGLGAAMTWLRPRTRGRLGAALLLLAITAYLGANIPPGPLGPKGLDQILIAVFPGLLVGLWGLSSFFLRWRSPAPTNGIYDPWMVLLPVVLAALIFVPPNYLAGLQRVLVSLDLESGEVLWVRPLFRAPPEQKWPRSSYATPTPATDGRHVFAYFGAGVSSVDFDGRIQWTTRFPEYSKNTRYGAGSSPVLTDDCVIILQESEEYQHPRPSWLTALNKETGERQWQIEPTDLRDSYATPLLLPTPSGSQIVTASWHLLLGFDPESGERLWSLDSVQEQTVASIASSGNLLALSGGVVGEKELLMVRMPDDGSSAPEVLWRSRKSVASIVSPVIYNGMLFTLTEAGIMACYDAASGEMLWRERLKGEYYGSLVAGDGKVYATSTDGRTTVIAADAEFAQLAVNSSAEGVFASLAVADGGFLIRSANELFFIEGKARP